MEGNWSRLFAAGQCVGWICSLLVTLAIVKYMETIATRLTGLMLAVQELCDRIWELRK